MRHSADKHIQSKVTHDFAVGCIPESRHGGKSLLKKRNCGLVAHGPTEFFIVHRIHREAGFLTGDADILRLFLDADQGAGFDVIVAVVAYQFLDCLAGFGAFLNLIQNDDGLGGLQGPADFAGAF